MDAHDPAPLSCLGWLAINLLKLKLDSVVVRKIELDELLVEQREAELVMASFEFFNNSHLLLLTGLLQNTLEKEVTVVGEIQVARLVTPREHQSELGVVPRVLVPRPTDGLGQSALV
jgi:hypothetical protein